ncbi:hypothetical protein BJ742DRAFT_743678 [Cladochytrium replicatum]|nr:hypothetical protein BJ742DRAFT_743678 [Cladochytrium replicatum]
MRHHTAEEPSIFLVPEGVRKEIRKDGLIFRVRRIILLSTNLHDVAWKCLGKTLDKSLKAWLVEQLALVLGYATSTFHLENDLAKIVVRLLERFVHLKQLDSLPPLLPLMEKRSARKHATPLSSILCSS